MHLLKNRSADVCSCARLVTENLACIQRLAVVSKPLHPGAQMCCVLRQEALLHIASLHTGA